MLYAHTTNPSKSQKSKPRAGNGVEQSGRFELKMLNKYSVDICGNRPLDSVSIGSMASLEPGQARTCT